ncbi:MAG: glycosyltransferase family 4 protein [Phycisphaerae bacterium]|nr:glycosyltransferase family 4 protein [Phycisphaerae bacterium]
MPTRVRIVQPLIPSYREPVFAALARKPELELEVWADLQWEHSSLTGAGGSDLFRCVHAPFRHFGPFAWQPALLRAIERGVDTVVMPWNSRCLQLGPALTKARRLGVRTVLWGHGIGKRESPWRRRVRNALARRADACLLYSPELAKQLVSEGMPRERVFVARNSLDQAPIVLARSKWNTARIDAFLTERECVRGRIVLFVSRLEPEKRADRLIDAVALVRRSVPDVRLVIVGAGPERDSLEARARRRDLPVRFEGPLYDEDSLAPWMLGAACLVQPGAIGLSLLHAFGFGLPVVTSDKRLPHGPEIEALDDRVNGFLYRDGDLSDLASKIVPLLTDVSLRAGVGAAALATVEREGGWNMDGMVAAIVAAVTGVR